MTQKPAILFEEALANMQGIVDHQRSHAVGLQPDRGPPACPFESVYIIGVYA